MLTGRSGGGPACGTKAEGLRPAGLLFDMAPEAKAESRYFKEISNFNHQGRTGRVNPTESDL
jgi:hypothetical protein